MSKINLEKYNLKFDYEFVPFSQSRHKDSDHKSLNYKVTITRGKINFTFDYVMGSGHVPMVKTLKMEQRQIIDRSCETGFKHIVEYGYVRATKDKIVPDFTNALWSCLMDAEVLEHPDFESWAGDFGYDTDSRSGEKIYKECLASALRFRQLFSCDEIEQLRELFQDY